LLFLKALEAATQLEDLLEELQAIHNSRNKAFENDKENQNNASKNRTKELFSPESHDSGKFAAIVTACFIARLNFLSEDCNFDTFKVFFFFHIYLSLTCS
jgi:hypothetical protein